MELDNISADISESFEKENQIPLKDAIVQIKKWIEEKNFPAAEDWIKQIEKHVKDLKEITALKEKLRNANSEKLQKSSDNVKEESVAVKTQSTDESTIACISYIWFLAIVPLVLKKDSPVCQHHWKQWLVYAIFFFFTLAFFSFVPGVWKYFVGWLKLLQLVLAIYWWIQAYKWNMWKAPWVGSITKKLNF